MGCGATLLFLNVVEEPGDTHTDAYGAAPGQAWVSG